MKLPYYFMLIIFILAMSGCRQKTLTEQFREVCEKDIADPHAAKDSKELSKILLGWSYIIVSERNIPKGLLLIKDVAESGNAHAQQILGGFYSEGHYVQKDTAKAIEWYKKAASQGNQKAKDALLKIQH